MAQARVIEYGFQPLGPFRFASDPPVDRSRAVYLTLDPVFSEPKKAFVLFAKADPVPCSTPAKPTSSQPTPQAGLG